MRIIGTGSDNDGGAIPLNRRGDDFGYLLPLEYGKNLVVLVGDDGQGNLSSKLFEVERSDKFRAEIASPVFGEFANGRELGVSGTVSAKYAEGTDEELGLAGVSATGVALSNLTLWGQSPIAVDETTGNVSYLLLMTGNGVVGGTNVVYTLNEQSFTNHMAETSTGTNSWPYDCALMTYSNSVKSISFTGFHNAMPPCGPDVTAALHQTRIELADAWAAMTPAERDDACDRFVSKAGWDMIGLVTHAYTYLCSECSPCDQSVWVDGGCHRTWSVNYVLYGWAFRLCGKSKAWMEATIVAHKTSEKKVGEIPAALGWARAGYAGWPVCATPPPDRRNCRECGVTSSKTSFRGRIWKTNFGDASVERP